MSDFEQSAQKGLLHVFPAVRIESCLFHLSQSVVRHVRSGNGVDFYQRNQDFRVFVRSLPALAFLPSDLVERAFDHLMESVDTSWRLSESWRTLASETINAPGTTTWRLTWRGCNPANPNARNESWR
ncbi:hypothetical protein L596_026785 [Steinernema carpocapsae]|uniref:MULE transposase domain-containing protein n=1 Tax=Steinernema carpocapsae TaxID=34508 RepID=A0A4U5M2D3_STECR|nr:hypothetical protein L596_026785 [Steinernema carpocapsae]